MGRPKYTPEKIWDFIDKSGGDDACWPWTGGTNKAGYGIICINWKQQLAHRIAYKLCKGDIPDGVFACHDCDNPPCCNPNHLFKGSPLENSSDMVSKGRQSKGKKHSKALAPNRPRGEKAYQSKVTEQDVREMRRLKALKFSVRHIANQFPISFSAAKKAIYGYTWNHVK